MSSEWMLDETVSPGLIGVVYDYMKTKHVVGDTLEAMERILGIDVELVASAIEVLEQHGYLAISRHSSPIQYRIIK